MKRWYAPHASRRCSLPDEKTLEPQVTPEEKLFRLIAAAGKDDAELQELFTRFSQQKVPGPFFGSIPKRDPVPFAVSPVLRTAILVLIGAAVFYFISGIRVGRTFYVSPGGRLAEVGIEHAMDFFPKFFGPMPDVKNVGGGVSPPLRSESVSPFRLVGISWDAQGPVAMIELPRSEHAKFVRRGDILDGNVRVEEIKDNAVILSSGKHRWELT